MARTDTTCLHWLEKFEGELNVHALSDPGSRNVEGFPQLRIDRFLASLSDKAVTQDTFAEWLEQMRQLDATGKLLAFGNLPAVSRKKLIADMPTGNDLGRALTVCGKQLNRLSLNNAEHKKILLKQMHVPDAYQSWKRIAGLYPVAKFAAKRGIKRLHRELYADFKIPLDKLPLQGKLIRYTPSRGDQLDSLQITAMFKHAYHTNPLAIPLLNSSELKRLFEHFAPVWEIDTRNNTDRIGSVGLDEDGQPHVNIHQPTVYIDRHYTRWHGAILLQLVYQIWLPAREKSGLLDLYGGHLDSVIWRVTLNPKGEPIAFDSIHACGCYYLLFPGKGFRAITPKDGAEAVLSPKSIDAIPGNPQLSLRLQSRTHYLQQVSIKNGPFKPSTRRSVFGDSKQLRSLPLKKDRKRSLFGNDGIIDASERAERFLLWPYGVASPGAMRQWGTHAIAFTGRRHFDDPYLLENLMDVK